MGRLKGDSIPSTKATSRNAKVQCGLAEKESEPFANAGSPSKPLDVAPPADEHKKGNGVSLLNCLGADDSYRDIVRWEVACV